MDAAFSPSGIIEEVNGLVEDGDFDGAEEVLMGALSAAPSRYEPFFQFQLGKLYSRWNKLTSAVNHLNRAAELAHASGDEIFLLQVVDELKSAKSKQASQKP